MSSKRERQRLLDIVENIDAISDYVVGLDFEGFAGDRKTVDAVERCIEPVCEAILKIGTDRMEEIDPGTSLVEVRGLGNLLRHSYDLIDRQIIWTMTQRHLPELRDACRKALVDA